MKKEIYIVSKKRVTYMEDKKIIWIEKFKNIEDRLNTISHLKSTNSKIVFV